MTEAKAPWGSLTRREVEIAKLVCLGQRRREVAARLKLTLNTFDSHRHSILTKLGVSNEVALLRLALTEGWLTL